MQYCSNITEVKQEQRRLGEKAFNFNDVFNLLTRSEPQILRFTYELVILNPNVTRFQNSIIIYNDAVSRQQPLNIIVLPSPIALFESPYFSKVHG